MIVIQKDMDDTSGMHQWLDNPRKYIEVFDLDILLYLDLTVRWSLSLCNILMSICGMMNFIITYTYSASILLPPNY